MIRLAKEDWPGLWDWFRPEGPGPLVGPHVLQTGHGACTTDRWSEPRTVLVETGGNYTLLGDPASLSPGELRASVRGFVEAPQTFEPLLRSAFPDLRVWDRVVLELPDEADPVQVKDGRIRRLEPGDARLLGSLSPASSWISNTWGGPDGLAASGCAWGGFVAGRLASVACTFFQGERYEDIGVVTEAEFRGQGLSTACAGYVCRDIRARGRRPSWTTSPDNRASLRVAEKLGFQLNRYDHLYVVGIPIPAP